MAYAAAAIRGQVPNFHVCFGSQPVIWVSVFIVFSSKFHGLFSFSRLHSTWHWNVGMVPVCKLHSKRYEVLPKEGTASVARYIWVAIRFFWLASSQSNRTVQPKSPGFIWCDPKRKRTLESRGSIGWTSCLPHSSKANEICHRATFASQRWAAVWRPLHSKQIQKCVFCQKKKKILLMLFDCFIWCLVGLHNFTLA